MTAKHARLLAIGEFSRATGLTVKTLRHYHERGILEPARVDAASGYRYYDANGVERARVIRGLRELELPLETIAEILAECREDEHALAFLERQREVIAGRIAGLEQVRNSLDHIIEVQRQHENSMNETLDIEDKIVDDQLIAGIRMHGEFAQCSSGFSRLGRSFGFGLAGKPGMLVYDEEYKPGDADFEVFFPIRRAKSVGADISVRTLPGGRCLAARHRGPYDSISTTYAKLFAALAERGLRTRIPSRELYIKGPGMIFRGNPNNYLTEVQLFLADEAA